MLDYFPPLALLAVLCVVFVTAASYLDDAACKARWSSDFSPTYSMFGGCQIIVDGHRIPAANYRVL